MTTGGEHRSSSAARRSRRRRRRRVGRGFVSLGYLCAVLAGGVALRAAFDDSPDAPSSAPNATLAPPRHHPVPTDAEAAGQLQAVSEAPPVTTSVDADGMVELSVESRLGPLPLSVPSAGLRPSPNSPPRIVAPREVTVAEGRDRLAGVSIVDPDALPGDHGLLLVAAGGSISVGSPEGVRFFGENGSNFLPLLGSVSALNEALAALQFDPGPRGGELFIHVTDFGHGNLAEARRGSARIAVT